MPSGSRPLVEYISLNARSCLAAGGDPVGRFFHKCWEFIHREVSWFFLLRSEVDFVRFRP
jgi:hypothetical protein